MAVGNPCEQIKSLQSSMVAPKQNENESSTSPHAGWNSQEDILGWVIKITWWSRTLFRMCGPLWPLWARPCTPAGCKELVFEWELTQRLFAVSSRYNNHSSYILSNSYVPSIELRTKYILSYHIVMKPTLLPFSIVHGVLTARILKWFAIPSSRRRWEEKKGTTEDEMVGWHHWLNGHEFEQTPGDSEGQGSLVCCSAWSHKELDTT